MSAPLVSAEIVLVGTGVSTAIPIMGHFGDCACSDALRTPNSKNKRNNVSLLIALRHQKIGEEQEKEKDKGSEETNVLIDCGKTFRSAYFEQLARRGLRRVDALLLTHDHADAIAGLDDLRDLQRFEEVGQHWRCEYFIPTYLSKDNARHALDAGRRLTLAVAPSLPLFTLPLEHGAGYTAMGYAFGWELAFKSPSGDNGTSHSPSHSHSGSSLGCVVYLSDVTIVPAPSMAFLQSLRRIDLLVVDLLLGPGRTHFSHACWDDAWRLADALRPRRVLGTGMYCDLKHDPSNERLASQLRDEHAAGRCLGVESFELAFDGLTLPLAVPKAL